MVKRDVQKSKGVQIWDGGSNIYEFRMVSVGSFMVLISMQHI
jgi:hypothetical protein